MLLSRKCKLSIFKIFLCSLILNSLVFVHNNSLEWIFMIWSHIWFQNSEIKPSLKINNLGHKMQNWTSIVESNWIFSKLYLLIYIYVGSQFSDRTHYNEFVENWSKSWALMRRPLVLGVNNTQNRMAQCPKEKGRLAQGRELPTPLA